MSDTSPIVVVDGEALVMTWASVIVYTGLPKHILQRAVAYYDFPKPFALYKGHSNVWKESDLRGWVAQKGHEFEKEKERYAAYRNT